MRLPKIYKPVIKTKQVSHSETMFPNLYKKKKVVYDDFSKIYLTNIKDIKEENPQLTLENTKEDEKENIRLNNLKYLNNTLISKQQHESSNITSPNVFARETINNRFMYSFKSNLTKRQTLYNKSSRYSNISPVRKNSNDLNIGYDVGEKVTIMTNYIPIL